MNARLLPVLLLLVATGCANSLRVIELEDGHERRDATTATYDIRAPEGPLRTAQVILQVDMQEVTVSSTARKVRLVEEFTPYRALRELYEVPAGLVALPFSVAGNALELPLLGGVPNAILDPFSAWAFAAANPFLNVESQMRVESRERGSRVLPSTAETFREQRPAAGQWLEVSLAGAPTVRLSTDEQGTLSVFLDELPWPSDLGIPRGVVASVLTSDGEAARVEIDLDSDFAEYLALNAVHPASRER